MGRYDYMLDKGPDPAPRKTKRLRFVTLDGMHAYYQEWWLDADGYPSHPVEAGDETLDVVLYAGACHTMEGRPMDEFELELEAVIRRFIEQGLDRDDIRASLIEAAEALDDTADQPADDIE